MKTSSETKTVITSAFTLALPQILQGLDPKYEIDLPQKHKALVFETELARDEYEAPGKTKRTWVKGFRVIIVNSKGRRSNKVYFGGYRNSEAKYYDTPDGRLDMKFDLESVANQLMPKTTRSSRYEEIEDDD